MDYGPYVKINTTKICRQLYFIICVCIHNPVTDSKPPPLVITQELHPHIIYYTAPAKRLVTFRV